MKNYSVILILLSFLIISCSKSKELAKEDKQEEPEIRYTPPPQPTNQYNLNRPREGTLSAAEIQKIQDLATQKAKLECKLERLQEQGESSNEQAVANKEMVIQLDGRLKVLQVDIDKFIDSKEKIQYFRRAFDQAFYDCNK